VRIVGFARREKSHEEWRAELRAGLEQFSRTKRVDAAVWDAFATNLYYCQGEFSEEVAYHKLGDMLSGFGHDQLRHNLVFYLSTSPSQFAEIVEHLSKAKLLRKDEVGGGWQRVVVEKPFGHDLASAQKLNGDLTRFAHEKQIYRIDHYLGKETVQNILMFRFSNAIFEQLWNRQSVDHIQITVSEKIGVGARGGYYEEAGALRDMVQNHLLQVLALIAMEPPVSLQAEAVRDEKVKLLKSIRRLNANQIGENVVRGQYSEGEVGGQARVAYRQETKVKPGSNVETYVAAKFHVDNWRWSGVPFYLRTGKNLALSASEVRIQFRPTPNVLFAAQCGPKLDANAITLRCSRTKASRFVSMARYRGRACRFGQCGCTSATILSLAPTHRRRMSGCCWKRSRVMRHCSSVGMRWKQRGVSLIPFVSIGAAEL
jgi:glucose-6-phosphate 1-dehydrogenase